AIGMAHDSERRNQNRPNQPAEQKQHPPRIAQVRQPPSPKEKEKSAAEHARQQQPFRLQCVPFSGRTACLIRNAWRCHPPELTESILLSTFTSDTSQICSTL